MRRLIAIGLTGIAIGALGILASFSPHGLQLEENIGLHGLFRMRGPRPTPAETVIVTMDMDSVHHFNLDPKPENWPRALHARLIDRLTARGAGAIAMDILFERPKSPKDDQRLADAIRRAGNVVLSSAIHVDRAYPQTGMQAKNELKRVNIEKVITPLPKFAEASTALAPFPLPKVPVKVSRFWTFKHSAGDLPTFPVAALHLYLAAHYEAFITLLEETGIPLPPKLSRTRAGLLTDDGVPRAMRTLRAMAQNAPARFKAAAGRLNTIHVPPLDEFRLKALRALLSIYTGPDSRYLNYYGSPGTINTMSYHTIFEPDSENNNLKQGVNLKDKIVFVGLSKRLRLDQEDGYYTVYSRPDGVDISGVEIAATAFSNLLDNSWIKPPAKKTEIALMIGWGIVIAFGVFYLPISLSLMTIAAGAGVFVWLAYYQFTTADTWFPLAVPLLLQMPVGFLGTLMLKHRDVQHERRNIRKAFGLYLPDDVVNRLAKDISHVSTDSRTVQGTCLFTDAARYTPLSETLTPDKLRHYLNQYYEILFEPIRRHEGIISDVVGDAVLALWPTTGSHSDSRYAACAGALEIDSALREGKYIEDLPVLPSRIGLHAGVMQLGNVGAVDHYEYRAVGDVVNTASRIEGLNKYLGTRILVSDAVLNDLDDVKTRSVGTFLLAGKSNPIALFELRGLKESIDRQIPDLCAVFHEGLALFRNRAWPKAEALFARALQIDGQDGPSAFYLNQCRRFQQAPPGDDWRGFIVMETK